MIKSYPNFDLSTRNTFAVKAHCDRFVEYDSPEDLPGLMAMTRGEENFMHIGAGSNLLFTCDYPGTVVHSAVKGIRELSRRGDEVLIEAGAGEVMDSLVAEMCRRNLWGLENLSGIPGEVGASAVQNVGAYGVEAGDAIVNVRAYDRIKDDYVTIPGNECDYGYRQSMFKSPENRGRYIILSVTFRLSSTPTPRTDYPALKDRLGGEPATPAEVREAVIAIRDSKLPDPAKVPSAGSFFKNPVVSMEKFEEIKTSEGGNVPGYVTDEGVKIPAAWLIDRCGWKGYREGNVGVWHLQPLVIVNPEGKASAAEIIALEDKIVSTVRERFGISLTPEVEHVSPSTVKQHKNTQIIK